MAVPVKVTAASVAHCPVLHETFVVVVAEDKVWFNFHDLFSQWHGWEQIPSVAAPPPSTDFISDVINTRDRETLKTNKRILKGSMGRYNRTTGQVYWRGGVTEDVRDIPEQSMLVVNEAAT